LTRELAAEAVRSGKEVKADLIANLQSGKTVYLHTILQPKMDSDGKVVQLFGAVQDITERKKAEEAIRESEQKFKSVVEASPDIIYLFDVKSEQPTFMNADFLLGHDLKGIRTLHAILKRCTRRTWSMS